MTVVWTGQAIESIERILDYLESQWSGKEVSVFPDVVQETIQLITVQPELFKVSPHDPQSREALLTRHTTMFYRIVENTLEIQYFWSNFQDPSRIKDWLQS